MQAFDTHVSFCSTKLTSLTCLVRSKPSKTLRVGAMATERTISSDNRSFHSPVPSEQFNNSTIQCPTDTINIEGYLVTFAIS